MIKTCNPRKFQVSFGFLHLCSDTVVYMLLIDMACFCLLLQIGFNQCQSGYGVDRSRRWKSTYLLQIKVWLTLKTTWLAPGGPGGFPKSNLKSNPHLHLTRMLTKFQVLSRLIYTSFLRIFTAAQRLVLLCCRFFFFFRRLLLFSHGILV